ncbi:hypothetical protein Hamer_G012025 [Homarus americanus]|uniref:Uncharacterized protein n=1 Tax=Homarus americanus TaxID=6706 RepID=A0A8J5JMN3_HOMAM|nr:hypothetical protein Hamer_G012025 [Homarus americanus]
MGDADHVQSSAGRRSHTLSYRPTHHLHHTITALRTLQHNNRCNTTCHQPMCNELQHTTLLNYQENLRLAGQVVATRPAIQGVIGQRVVLPESSRNMVGRAVVSTLSPVPLATADITPRGHHHSNTRKQITTCKQD